MRPMTGRPSGPLPTAEVLGDAVPIQPDAAAGSNGHAARARKAVPGRLVRNVVLLLSSQIVIWVVTFISNVFVPRGLGPAGMGELTVATSVGTILDTIFALGYGALMVKEIARDHSRAPALVGTALTTRAFLLLPGAATVVLLTALLHATQQLTVLIWLAAAATFLGLFTGPFSAGLQAMERMEYTALSNVLSRTVVALASIVLVAFGYGAVHILAMTIGVTVLTAVAFWWWSRPLFGVDWSWDWDRARFMVIGSLPYWSAALLLSFYMWIDSLMLSAMAPMAQVGWYAVPIRLFAALLFVPAILSQAYAPRLARAFVEGREEMGGVARRYLELVLSASLPVAGGLVLIGWQLVWVLYGRAYLPSVPILTVVALSLPPTYVNIVANQVLIAADRQMRWMWVMAGASIVNPALNLFLIPFGQQHWGNGALGAAFALLVTESAMAVCGVVMLVPVLRWSVAVRLARAAAATVVMLVVVALIGRRFGLTVMVVGGALSFGLAAAAFGVLRPDERRTLRSLVGRVYPSHVEDEIGEVR